MVDDEPMMPCFQKALDHLLRLLHERSSDLWPRSLGTISHFKASCHPSDGLGHDSRPVHEVPLTTELAIRTIFRALPQPRDMLARWTAPSEQDYMAGGASMLICRCFVSSSL